MNFFDLLIACALLALAFLVGTVSYKSLTTPDVVTHCYVEAEDIGRLPTYALKGNIEWHQDRTIGYFSSLNEAQGAMTVCPVGR